MQKVGYASLTTREAAPNPTSSECGADMGLYMHDCRQLLELGLKRWGGDAPGRLGPRVLNPDAPCDRDIIERMFAPQPALLPINHTGDEGGAGPPLQLQTPAQPCPPPAPQTPSQPPPTSVLQPMLVPLSALQGLCISGIAAAEGMAVRASRPLAGRSLALACARAIAFGLCEQFRDSSQASGASQRVQRASDALPLIGRCGGWPCTPWPSRGRSRIVALLRGRLSLA